MIQKLGAAFIKAFAATGATQKHTLMERARRFIFSDDYASKDAEQGAAINEAIAGLRADHSTVFSVGGTVRVGRGRRKVSSPIQLNSYKKVGEDESDAVTLKGDSAGGSELLADGLPAGRSVIESNQDGTNSVQTYNVEDLATRGGHHGLHLKTASRGIVNNLTINSTTHSGMRVDNSWVNIHSRIQVAGAGMNGFDYDEGEQKTSTTSIANYALRCAASGHRLGFMNYSAGIGLAADQNGHHGYLFRKTQGYTLIAPGSEQNGRAGIMLESSNEYGANRNITVLDGFMHNNNDGNSGYANLCHAIAKDGVANEITLRNCVSHMPKVNYGIPCVISKGKGSIVTIDNCIMPNGWDSQDGGWIRWTHGGTLTDGINFGPGSARVIGSLRSTQGHRTTYGGLITVHVGNAAPSSPAGSTSHGRKVATYLLLVNKSQTGSPTVTVVSSSPLGSSDVDEPGFTWSINGVNQLVAAGSTAQRVGTFHFEVTTDGQVVFEKA